MLSKNTNTNYTSVEADRLLQEELPKIQNEIKHFAYDLAEDKLPKLDDLAYRYFPTIKTLLQNLLESLLIIIQASKARLEGQSLSKIYKEKEVRLGLQINEATQDIRVFKRNLRDLGEDLAYRIMRLKFALVALIILSCADVLANYQFFEVVAANTLMACGIACGIAGSIFLLAHQTPKILNLFSSRKSKVLAFLGLIILMIAVFYVIANLRLIYGIEESPNSPWSIVLLNIFMYFVSSLLMIFTLYRQRIKFVMVNKRKFLMR